MKSVPVVDLGKIRDDVKGSVKENPDWKEAAEQIRDGLGAVGFMYLVNHGISEETLNNAFLQSKRFFELPLEVKMKFRKNISGASSGSFDMKNYSGYMPVGGEITNSYAKLEMKETFDWVNKKYSIPTTEEISDLHESIIQLNTDSKRLFRKLFKLLALALKLEEDFFLQFCGHYFDEENYLGLENIRFLHYPKILDKEDAMTGAIRCGEHSDYGFLTMLFQDDVGGLEVLNTEGEWIEAIPIPGSIVINTGNLIEFWTTGIFPATKHRIRIPNVDDERRMKERYSIACFSGPDTGALITPMNLEKKPKEKERLQKSGIVYGMEPINAKDYMMKLVALQYSNQITQK